jgi:hypothetical protein
MVMLLTTLPHEGRGIAVDQARYRLYYVDVTTSEVVTLSTDGTELSRFAVADCPVAPDLLYDAGTDTLHLVTTYVYTSAAVPAAVGYTTAGVLGYSWSPTPPAGGVSLWSPSVRLDTHALYLRWHPLSIFLDEELVVVLDGVEQRRVTLAADIGSALAVDLYAPIYYLATNGDGLSSYDADTDALIAALDGHFPATGSVAFVRANSQANGYAYIHILFDENLEVEASLDTAPVIYGQGVLNAQPTGMTLNTGDGRLYIIEIADSGPPWYTPVYQIVYVDTLLGSLGSENDFDGVEDRSDWFLGRQRERLDTALDEDNGREYLVEETDLTIYARSRTYDTSAWSAPVAVSDGEVAIKPGVAVDPHGIVQAVYELPLAAGQRVRKQSRDFGITWEAVA